MLRYRGAFVVGCYVDVTNFTLMPGLDWPSNIKQSGIEFDEFDSGIVYNFNSSSDAAQLLRNELACMCCTGELLFTFTFDVGGVPENFANYCNAVPLESRGGAALEIPYKGSLVWLFLLLLLLLLLSLIRCVIHLPCVHYVSLSRASDTLHFILTHAITSSPPTPHRLLRRDGSWEVSWPRGEPVRRCRAPRSLTTVHMPSDHLS
jgi:hypothetical protein